jgi:hypothetical protein
MTYLTPGEQEAALASALEAVLDEGESRLVEVCAMNRRVRDRLFMVINDMRHAVDDGDREVMRSALLDARVALGDLLDSRDDQATKVIIVEWDDEA